MATGEAKVRLNLNNPALQDNLLRLQKAERHVALDTLHKIRQLTWNQLYQDAGLKWEKTWIHRLCLRHGIARLGQEVDVLSVILPPLWILIEGKPCPTRRVSLKQACSVAMHSDIYAFQFRI